MTAQIEKAAFTPARTLPNGGSYWSKYGLFDFQADGVAETYLRTEPGRHSGALCVYDTGLGKMSPVSEPVLTPEGWKPIGKIGVGDEVIGKSGRATRVIGVYPQESRDVYRVAFSDGSWTRCGSEHLWTVHYWGVEYADGRQKRVERTKTATLAELMKQGIKNSAGRRKFWIPIVEPVQYPPVELPMDPYALGVALGDGWIQKDGTVSLATDAEILDTLGLATSRRAGRGCEQQTTRVWRGALVSLGLNGRHAAEKFVPESYLRAPEADRRALLTGLLDTDGSPIEDGGVEFSSASEQLVHDVIDLVESLGGQARLGKDRIPEYTHLGERRTGQRSWRVNLKLPEQPFRLARKAQRWVPPTKYPVKRLIESIERIEDEDSVCIKVDAPDELYVTRHHIVTHNTHVAMGLAAMLFEDDAIDLVMVVAERNKITDWRDDFHTHTALQAHRYHGTGRQKRLSKEDNLHVFVTTYETARNELMGTVKVKGHRQPQKVDGPLMETLGLRHKRVLWVFDEVTKLRGRSSMLHKAFDYVMRELRKGPQHHRVLGLTATPMESNFGDAYNVGRIVCPERMPTVERFDATFVRDHDSFGNPIYDRGKLQVFAQIFQGIILRKRKTDADVIAQFPKQIEESIKVTMAPTHADLYATVEGLFDPPEGEEDTRSEEERQRDERRLYGILRMTAGHPASHLHASNEISRAIVDAVGEDTLRAIPSSKVDELLARLKPIVKGQGSQAVVFTFYGNTVLRELVADLRQAGFSVVAYHGGNSLKQNDDAKRDFVAGQAEILVTSDAGSRGLNLQNAEYVFEYESALTHANRTQRINRIHRIDSDHPLVTCYTMVVEDSIEESIMDKVLQRNADQDMLLGDDDDGGAFISAAQRREMLQAARTRRRRR